MLRVVVDPGQLVRDVWLVPETQHDRVGKRLQLAGVMTDPVVVGAVENTFGVGSVPGEKQISARFDVPAIEVGVDLLGEALELVCD